MKATITQQQSAYHHTQALEKRPSACTYCVRMCRVTPDKSWGIRYYHIPIRTRIVIHVHICACVQSPVISYYGNTTGCDRDASACTCNVYLANCETRGGHCNTRRSDTHDRYNFDPVPLRIPLKVGKHLCTLQIDQKINGFSHAINSDSQLIKGIYNRRSNDQRK